ncbi:putative helicase [Corynebacterium kutscheri]|uniref:Helicase n=1 Tax=Corynebacterium kutscheri TaxID=35755 RepID=A0A0F6R0A1_9CORY|nr:DEAD/DEAH box helicase [Corynebacterium kutscheri]AKE41180.1 DNA/RNA helicase, superfamily II [Corynebacterium kutscheri]VEH08456.1 putative helicase [Corynebacterium kutscheri]VEH09502.1 putative helicase [Corynebacterium kutscheri]VEH79585.1 putative helicase [Corynebacterium kutscheri]
MTLFSTLGLPKEIVSELSRSGITEAFPIQAAAIPDALAGKDVLGRGPTGSGKTFTFGLPIIARLAAQGASVAGKPRALILVPTRELAAQVRQRLSDPARVMGLRIIDIVGGVNINHHIRQLAAPVDILVGTPGRIQDLINQHKLFLDQVAITALDEADQMADMGFLPQVTKLLALTNKNSQRLLFSATLDNDVDKLVKKFLHNPVIHSTAPAQAAVATMQHYQVRVGQRPERNVLVAKIAARHGKTIMFMRTKHGVDRQVKKLRRVGINAVGLHGDKGQSTRTKALEGFSTGTVPVLVATDIAARGIDISDVDLVVHVDPPAEHKAYLHRAGRTARAGATGLVLTLVMDTQIDEVEKLLKKAGVHAKLVDSHSVEKLTGAQEPHGSALPPFGAIVEKTSPHRTKTRKSSQREQAFTARRAKKRNAQSNTWGKGSVERPQRRSR